MSYNGRESGSINGREPPLGQYVETADYVIFRENGTIKAKDGDTGSIVKTGDYLNEVLNSIAGGITPPPTVRIRSVSDPPTYPVNAPIKNVRYVMGFGNWKPAIKLVDGANCNMFEYTNDEAIFELTRLRLMGNHENNTSGSGVYNTKMGEGMVRDCEIRSFPDHGIHYNALVFIGGYHIIHDSWLLDNQSGNIRLETDGGTIARVNLWNNVFVGDQPNGVHIPSGADVNKVNITGNRFKKAKAVHCTFKGGQDFHITGNYFEEIRSGNYGVRFIPPSAHSFYAHLQGNTFEGAGTGLEVNADADYIDVINNKFRTNLATPMDIASGGNPNGVVSGNILGTHRGQVTTSELELVDSGGNVFGRIEDTADGAKLELYDETETKQGEIFIGTDGRLKINSPNNDLYIQQGGGNYAIARGAAFETPQGINIRGEEFKNLPEGTTTSDPTTDAPDGWVVYTTQAGNTRYIPFYT